ncbi:MAG TPA: hypothetical protein VFE62_07430 [Gemmataceae bacterium]|nr:hypothetical protein [Gemmataceae bacterium]
MSGPYDLTPPDNSTGYRPPRFMNATLTLDPQLALLATQYPIALGWHLQPRLSVSPIHLGLTYGDLDDVLAPYLCQYSILTTQQPNQAMTSVLPQAMAGASNDTALLDAIRDAVADAAQDKFWTKIPGRGKNYATGEQASIGSVSPGSVDSSGRVLPSGTTVYDDLDKVVPGSALKLPLSLGKRFGFSSGNDVYFKLYVDKDAVTGQYPTAPITGGSFTIEGKTSDGLSRKLTIIGGRGQTTGPAGAVVLEATFW